MTSGEILAICAAIYIGIGRKPDDAALYLRHDTTMLDLVEAIVIARNGLEQAGDLGPEWRAIFKGALEALEKTEVLLAGSVA